MLRATKCCNACGHREIKTQLGDEIVAELSTCMGQCAYLVELRRLMIDDGGFKSLGHTADTSYGAHDDNRFTICTQVCRHAEWSPQKAHPQDSPPRTHTTQNITPARPVYHPGKTIESNCKAPTGSCNGGVEVYEET